MILFLFLYMKEITDYIIEKLVIDANVNKSNLADIYNVKVNDKVLVITHSEIAPKKFVSLFVAKISSIHDNKFFVKNIHNGKEIPKIVFEFEDPHHSTPRVSECFGFWKGLYDDKPSWVATCKKDRAIKVINNKLNKIRSGNNITWNGMNIKPNKGMDIRQTLKFIIESLEKDD